MVNWSFLSVLPFVGHWFKKSTYIEYVKSYSSDCAKSLVLDSDKQYECKCCLEFCNADDMVTCTESTKDDPHTFCKECISRYIIHGINDNVVRQGCMCFINSKNCKGVYTSKVIFECVEKETHDKFEELFEIREVKKFCKLLKDYQICPHCQKCGIIANKDILKCKKQDCKKKWCSKCKHPEHKGYGCNKIIDSQNIDAIRITVEETINSALTHKCPKCSSIYIKEEGNGCNHMTCTVCDTRSCYICGLVSCSCPAYNDNLNNNLNDKGNWLYNRKKIIKACKELLMENDKDVQIIICKELEKHGIYISVEDL